MTSEMDRRAFMRASGLVALGAVAAACSGDNEKNPPGSLDDLTAGKEHTMQVVSVQPLLARPNDRLSLGLLSKQGQPMGGGTARGWLARSRTEKAIPVALEYHGQGFEGRGTYIGRFSFPANAAWLIYVQARPDGATKTLDGGAPLQVGERVGPPTGPKQPIPGEKAISVVTPTTANARGVKPICTRVNPTTRKREPCTMHALSLDQALRNGKPTVLIIGTPAFCETRYCGPVVEELMKVKATPLGSKLNFVHVELYKDDTNAPAAKEFAPAVRAWHIEAEPVIYYIAPDGTIADWAIGASDAPEMTQTATALV